jgi:endogenous inhibitor of DNA gyrase (YacG/DUF329 family)
MIDREPRTCPKCGITCKGKHGLASHKRNCETGKYPPCPECGTKSVHKDGVLQNEQRYMCNNCKKRFLETTEVYKNCLICGKELHNIRKQRKYCSINCKSKAYYNKHKEQEPKILARRKTNSKIKIPNGLLCQDCGIEKAKIKHHIDYDKPLWVLFLCKPCHKKRHERLKNV